MKIDIFPHILTPKYKEAILQLDFPDKSAREAAPMLFDLDIRFRVMDKYDGYMQVLTISGPAIEGVAEPAKAAEIAKIANDEMAELVTKYPHRFAGAVACLPMNNMEEVLKETDRAIMDLGFRGVQVYSPVNDKPLDSPEFIPLYEKMAQYNLPIWIHPRRGTDYADYRTLDKSKYRINATFGWPYETTAAMTHLVFSGIFDRLPNLKFITHHAGAMVPYFEDRIKRFYDKAEIALGHTYMRKLTKAPIEYYKMFYNDTALYGDTPALMCANTFFGADHLLFGTDMPLGDGQLGYTNPRWTIEAIEQMDIPDADKKKIFEDNARQLLRLPV